MSNKRLTWLIAGSIIVLGIIISSILSSQKEPMRRRPATGGIKPLKILTVRNQDIHTQIEMTGPLYAYDKVELYAEVSGVLLETNRRFKEGNRYQQADILVQIDDRVYKNNVLAQKSNLLNQLTLLLPDLSIDFPQRSRHWESYLSDFHVEKTLAPLPEPESDQERYYIASRNIYGQYYSIKSMEETLAKYTLKAPFNGIVNQANINPGTLVRTGQKLGEFTNTELYEMEAAVSVRDVDRLKVGQKVTLISEVIPGTFEGRIQRMNHVIDRNSMTVKIYIHTRDPLLRDGMYLTALAQADPISNAYAVAKDLLIGEDQIYTVQDSILISMKVTVVSEEGDQVIVRGLPDGTRILGEYWADAREGIRLPKSEAGGHPQGPGMQRPADASSPCSQSIQAGRNRE